MCEAPHEKRGGGFDDVVIGLKPGDVQWPDLRINLRPVAGLSRLSRIARISRLTFTAFDCTKAHKRFHLVHVAAHRLRHVLRPHPVCVQRVMPQGGLMHQAPQQAVQQAKTVGIAVQDDGLTQR